MWWSSLFDPLLPWSHQLAPLFSDPDLSLNDPRVVTYNCCPSGNIYRRQQPKLLHETTFSVYWQSHLGAPQLQRDRTSALALCYSTAEYCAPVWSRSSHIQLNETMRFLLHISNVKMQCPSGSTKWNSVITYHFSVTLHPTLWLPSRHPVWRVNPAAVTTCFSRWRDDWQSATVINSSLVDDPTVRPPGYHLTRRQWSLLNRFWKGQGHCGTSKEMGSDRQWNACLRRHPDNVTYCWFLPADWTRRWSTTYTRCRQCCWLADVIRHIEAYETLQYCSDLGHYLNVVSIATTGISSGVPSANIATRYLFFYGDVPCLCTPVAFILTRTYVRSTWHIVGPSICVALKASVQVRKGKNKYRPVDSAPAASVARHSMIVTISKSPPTWRDGSDISVSSGSSALLYAPSSVLPF